MLCQEIKKPDELRFAKYEGFPSFHPWDGIAD
jgi:hypothetical protein